MVNNAQTTELVLVQHTRPIPIPSKHAGIGPIPIDTKNWCSFRQNKFTQFDS